ncbi:HisA/HisF-related TIM barrel protein [Nanoarchaeota archaeon]
MIIPSIDLMDGKAVQLKQGKEKIVERENVFEIAEQFSNFEIAVIDLDAALNKGSNIELIKQLCQKYKCRVGGGIRTVKIAKELIDAGATKIIIGTKAEKRFIADLLKVIPKEKIIVAIDTKGDFIVNKGWTKMTYKTPYQLISELEEYCSEFLFTNVNIEGTMQGFCLRKIEQIQNATFNKITAAGGITTIDQMQKLEKQNINSQIGMALYTGRINMNNLIKTFIKS